MRGGNGTQTKQTPVTIAEPSPALRDAQEATDAANVLIDSSLAEAPNADELLEKSRATAVRLHEAIAALEIEIAQSKTVDSAQKKETVMTGERGGTYVERKGKRVYTQKKTAEKST
jgi:hypothetical protein